MSNLFRFNDWPFRTKILVALILIAVLPLSIISAIQSITAANSLRSIEFAALQSTAAIKLDSLEDWFEDHRRDMELYASRPAQARSVARIPDALTELGDGDYQTGVARMVELYSNPETIDAGDGSTYSVEHAFIAGIGNTFVQLYEYEDIYIVTTDGTVVYSFNKGAEFGTNLVDGPLADTGLGTAFRQMLQASETEVTILTDFEYYPPIDDSAAFIATPFIADGEITAIAITRIPTTRLDEIAQERTGLGETGETYLVGEDKLFRTDSRFLEELGVTSTRNNPDIVVDTVSANAALAGECGQAIITDYRGEEVF
ncbi:MAG: hypothetical protein GYB68_01330, partial [Chloroflexi bacterium]|nr:hypothetical protein [Chloroflexota bacterium]